MNRPTLIIDGLNLFMRHFVVNPTIDDSGEHIGGVVGFLKSLSLLVSRTNPQRIIVVWEGGGSPRRRKIFPSYKQNRRPQKLNRYYEGDIPDTVENRNNQVAKIVSILDCVPVDQFYVSDCEADDIIAYLVKYLVKDKVVIVSSDKDLYQLLSKRVIQWSPGQKKFVTIKDIPDRFGVSSVNFCTARCFIGDSSDGLPGIKLAGFRSLSKRFPKLIENNFVSVEEVIKLASEVEEKKRLKIHNNIIENPGIPETNWKLMYLDIKNLSAEQIKKVEFEFENSAFNCDKFKMIKLMSKLGIKNFDIDNFFSSLNSIRNTNV